LPRDACISSFGAVDEFAAARDSPENFKFALDAQAADHVETATDYAASTIANRHGSGEVAAKIQHT
jgi:hypothetical protein